MSAPSGLPVQDPASVARRLPTRVNNACRRCRRNKTRCDSFRPCALCLRAGSECEPSAAVHSLRGDTRYRAQDQRQNQRRRAWSAAHGTTFSRSTSAQPAVQPALRVEQDDLDGVKDFEDVEQRPESAQEPDRITPRTSWSPVDYGESESAMEIARKICRLGSQTISGRQTSAIPDGECGIRTLRTRTGDKRLRISTILGSRFPDQQLMNSLLEHYFDSVHWFSLVILEPKLRQRLLAIRDGCVFPAEQPFLVLLSMILCMASWYKSKTYNEAESKEMRLWSNDLLKIVESRLADVMDQHSMAAVQTCILLGSHHVYHGRPNLSFALLGAAVKIAQAMGLHRDSARQDSLDVEERKRVWWTIYTWDRFASISYGRPLSINDDDCNVSMPTDFSESPHFVQQPTNAESQGIVYSSYQTELSKLYLTASDALKTIFGSRSSSPSKQPFGADYASLVNDVTQRLMAWRHELPAHLSLDLEHDYRPAHSSLTTRAYTLQSLSLQLTFDNLMIVLYRPVLARQVENLSLKSSASHSGAPEAQWSGQCPSPYASNRSAPEQDSPMSEATASSEYCWSAAVRTTRVTELPLLAQLATDSHLVAFVAMNLFHAAIVLISLALSDPLSDRAQGVKRTITRVFRLQEVLGQRSTLSSQSSDVLKELIYLLARREAEAMLAPVTTVHESFGSHHHQQPQPLASEGSMSVEDTLRFPIEPTRNASDLAMSRQGRPVLSKTQRLRASLASVQRAFPASQDQLLQRVSPQDAGDEGHLQDWATTLVPNQMWPMSFAPDNNFQPQTMNTGDQMVSEGTNSLFWLWDNTWEDGGSGN